MTPPVLLAVLALPAAADRPTPLSLAAAGRTSYRVVLHRGATAPERHAAEELARFLHEIPGATFPVEKVANIGVAPPVTIRVGPGAATGIISAGEIARLGSEGYVLRTWGLTLAIAGGRPRGTPYGVYSFLGSQLD